MGDTKEQRVMEMPGTMKEEEEERNKQPQQEVRRVYRDMNTPKCGDKDGGWRQVAYINVTNGNNTCPEGLILTVVNQTCKPTPGNSECVPLPIPMCIRSHSEENGCSSVIFPTDGKAYTKVCGRARGYQFGFTRAFHSSKYAGQDLNSAYVSGLSVTHGKSGNRKHIWTFAAGYSNAYGYIAVNCPCAQYPGPEPPEFVGDNYYCDSGNPDNLRRGWYLVDMVTNPLWNCDECKISNARKCCKGMGNEKRNGECEKWFTTNVGNGTAVTDNIEVRWCHFPPYTCIEDIGVDQLEIYVY